jgi:hypothetical protein
MCMRPLYMQRTARAEDDAEAMQAADDEEEGEDGVWLAVVPAAVLSRIRVLLGLCMHCACIVLLHQLFMQLRRAHS